MIVLPCIGISSPENEFPPKLSPYLLLLPLLSHKNNKPNDACIANMSIHVMIYKHPQTPQKSQCLILYDDAIIQVTHTSRE